MCVLAIAADGVIQDDELRRVVTSLAEKRLFRGQRLEDLGRLLNTAAKNIQKRGPAVVMEAAKEGLPQDLRETAFAMATDLMFSDGEVDSKEQKFLEEFQKALGIKDDLVLKIAEVMQVKNRG